MRRSDSGVGKQGVSGKGEECLFVEQLESRRHQPRHRAPRLSEITWPPPRTRALLQSSSNSSQPSSSVALGRARRSLAGLALCLEARARPCCAKTLTGRTCQPRKTRHHSPRTTETRRRRRQAFGHVAGG
eukprot:scaffold88340_cov24-Tisochrysis_lutea.AAC.2